MVFKRLWEYFWISYLLDWLCISFKFLFFSLKMCTMFPFQLQQNTYQRWTLIINLVTTWWQNFNSSLNKRPWFTPVQEQNFLLFFPLFFPKSTNHPHSAPSPPLLLIFFSSPTYNSWLSLTQYHKRDFVFFLSNKKEKSGKKIKGCKEKLSREEKNGCMKKSNVKGRMGLFL